MNKIDLYTEEFLTEEDLKILLIDCGYRDYISYPINIIPVKSNNNSSFVDAIINIYNNGEIVKKMVVEITQTTDKDSRNTSSYQRIIKFIYAKIYLPDYEQLMYYTKPYNSSTKTSDIGLNMLRLLGVRVVNVKYKKMDLNELIKLKKIISKRNPKNTPLFVEINNQNVIISSKLKNGRSWSDPNIGFVSAMIAILSENGFNQFKIINHDLPTKKLISTNNKLRKLINHLNVTVNWGQTNIIWNGESQIDSRDKYYEILEVGEKISMINFVKKLMKNDKVTILFKNIAGCERSKLNIGGNLYSIPKNIKIPDVIYSIENDIYFIEGESVKNVEKGLKQILNFGQCIDFVLSKFDSKNKNIYTYVITDLPSNNQNKNYCGYFLNESNFKLNYEIIR